MKNEDLSMTISIDRTPDEVFAAINDVRAWWSGDLEGGTDKVGDEFTYRYEDLHYSKQRVVELVPGKRVVWLVVDSRLEFVEHKEEWTGTRVVFDIVKKPNGTEVRFTHVGLRPDHDCYDACSGGWSTYIKGSLRGLLTTGKGAPNGKAKGRAPRARA